MLGERLRERGNDLPKAPYTQRLIQDLDREESCWSVSCARWRKRKGRTGVVHVGASASGDALIVLLFEKIERATDVG
jgi:hypothetical protein